MSGPGLQLGKSKQTAPEAESKANAFTQKAAIQTAVTENPPPVEPKKEVQAEQQVEQVQQQSQVNDNKFPWRDKTSMSEDELMYVKQKKSFDIPKELLYRLEFLRAHEKPKNFGQKIYESQQIIEALDEYTTKRLKALGYSVK